MSKIMKSISIISVVLTIVFVVLYNLLDMNVFYTLGITFGTIAYHFCIRLLIGTIYQVFMKNKADYNRSWYQLSKFEEKLYNKIGVKKWKNKMSTYNSDFFNPELHTWDEIAQAMCQAELVHETIVIFSFLPIAASIWFGSLGVFIITSVLSVMFDTLFAIMQRYNRPRIIRIIGRTRG